MSKFKYKCESCDNSFSILYVKELSDDLQYCVFCGEYLILENEKDDNEIFFVEEDNEYENCEE